MKILFYGSKGWIGKQFVKVLEENNENFEEGKCRVDDEKELMKEIKNISPTHIISFIGRTHGKINNKNYPTIDYLEQEGKIYENIRDNLFSPVILANICKERNIHLTYLGTGCIFNYDEYHPLGNYEYGFTENCEPNFFGSSYSIVKGFTDRIMHSYNNVLNLRIRMPISDDNSNRNFITKIINYQYICSIPNSMSVLPELLPYVLDMMRKNISGTINLTNPGVISHNEILTMYKEIVNPNFTWKNFTKEEQSKILCCDRSNNCLNTKKIETLYPNIKNIKESIKNCIIKYKKNIK